MIYMHLVFCTKDVHPYFTDTSLRNNLHKKLAAASRKVHCPASIINGSEDHVHILASLTPNISADQWVAELKASSRRWLKEEDPHTFGNFDWQTGYAMFSLSRSYLEKVREYIRGQEDIHRHIPYRDELRILLQQHNIEFDEKDICD
jgi:putative transposase